MGAAKRRSTPIPGHRGIRHELIDGRWVYRVQIQQHKARRSAVRASLEEAIALKREWTQNGIPTRTAGPVPALVDAGPPPAVMPEALETVRHALRAHVDALIRRGKDAKTVGRARQVIPMLEREWPALLAKPLDQVSAEDFEAFGLLRQQARPKRSGAVAGCTPHTIRRDMTVLRAAIKAKRRDFVLPAEVMPAVGTRVRFLSPAEVAMFEAACVAAGPIGRIGLLMLEIISRQDDWRELRVDAVQLTERRIEFPEAKGTVRAVDALSDRAVELLTAQIRSLPEGAEILFANPQTLKPYSSVHVYRVLAEAIRATGRKGFTPHDLKHHAASSYAAAGATERELRAAGGWKTDQASKYVHVRSDRLRSLAESVSAMNRGEVRA